jgi:hypothetical protein
MILAVNGVSVRGKGTVAVRREVSKATGAVQLDLAALRSDPPSARKAWHPECANVEADGDVGVSESISEVHDDSAGPEISGTVASATSTGGFEPTVETVVLGEAPASLSASRSRKRKSAAKKCKNHTPQGASHQAGDSGAATKRCELCRCSVTQALVTVQKRASAEVTGAFPTGFREGYCCDCYDKLVTDIKQKKALQAVAQRTKAAMQKKATDEKDEEEVQRKASNLPTLDEHFRSHGVEAYSLNQTDSAGAATGYSSGKDSSGGRGVRALRKFPAAVTVWTEPPYVALLRYERWGARCQSCFMTAAEANEVDGDTRSKQRSLSACSRCGCVKYCCRDCQKNDWPDHKHECAVLKRRAASASKADRREDTIDADILMARIWRRRRHSAGDKTSNPRKEYARSFAYADLEEEEHLQSHEHSFAKELQAVRHSLSAAVADVLYCTSCRHLDTLPIYSEPLWYDQQCVHVASVFSLLLLLSHRTRYRSFHS